MRKTYIITRSLDATEWGMTSATGLASNPSLQTDTEDRAMILVEAFEADTAEEASKRFDEVRNARCADLDGALAEVERMRPVVEAAKTWKDSRGLSNTSALFRAVDAYYENSAPAHGAHDQAHQADMEEQLRNARIGRQSYQESWVAAKRRFEKAEARIAELEKICSTLHATCNDYEKDIADLQAAEGDYKKRIADLQESLRESLSLQAISPITKELEQKLGWEQAYIDDVFECLESALATSRASLRVKPKPKGDPMLLVDNDALIEALADLEHERWSGWEKYREKAQYEYGSVERAAGTSAPSRRWRRLRETPYAELSEKEKESDRVEARKSIEVMKRHLLPFSKVRAVLKVALAWRDDHTDTDASMLVHELADAIEALPAEVREVLGD